MNAMSLFDNLTVYDPTRKKNQEAPFPRVPQECVEAVAGDNSFPLENHSYTWTNSPSAK
jgi:hypothetical protein